MSGRASKVMADLATPIKPPSRPMRPSDYGTPRVNWPALAWAFAFTAVALVGTLRLAGVL